jgi:hypothetical protein
MVLKWPLVSQLEESLQLEWQYLDFVFPILSTSRETFINTLALSGCHSCGTTLGRLKFQDWYWPLLAAFQIM